MNAEHTGPSAARRLGIFAGAIGVLAGVAFVVNAIVWVRSDELPNAVLRLASGMSLALLSAGVFALWRAGASARLLKVGWIYQLLGALCLALPEYLGEYFLDPGWWRLVPLAGWIVALPLFVPAHPVKHLGLSLVSASLPALLYWTWLSSEDMFGADAETLAKAFLPLFGCALLSVASAVLGRRASPS